MGILHMHNRLLGLTWPKNLFSAETYHTYVRVYIFAKTMGWNKPEITWLANDSPE